MGDMASTVLQFRDVSVVRDGNLILDTVTRGRREVRRLAYLSLDAPPSLARR